MKMIAAMFLAHPGHGTTDPESWRHYLTEPVHVLTALAIVALAVVTWRGYRRVTRRVRSVDASAGSDRLRAASRSDAEKARN